MPGEYEKLTQELDDILAKAAPVDDTDKKIEEAADGADLPGGDDNKDDKDEGDEAFMKSFQVTLANGETADAYDATLMVKALHAQARRQAATIADLQQHLAGAHTVLAKLPEMMKSLTAQIAEQGALIKALREAPGGRRSVTATTEDAPAKPTRSDILAKALGAQKDGRIGSFEVAQVEAHLNQGKPLPANLARAVGAA